MTRACLQKKNNQTLYLACKSIGDFQILGKNNTHREKLSYIKHQKLIVNNLSSNRVSVSSNYSLCAYSMFNCTSVVFIKKTCK